MNTLFKNILITISFLLIVTNAQAQISGPWLDITDPYRGADTTTALPDSIIATVQDMHDTNFNARFTFTYCFMNPHTVDTGAYEIFLLTFNYTEYVDYILDGSSLLGLENDPRVTVDILPSGVIRVQLNEGAYFSGYTDPFTISFRVHFKGEGSELTALQTSTVGLTQTSSDQNSFSFNISAPSVPLPITLGDFTAKKINEAVGLLEWHTLSNTDINTFIVEKSNDGTLWNYVGKVAAKIETKNYSLQDNQPYNGLNYYRLKMVTTNSKYSYSEVRQLFFNTKTNIAVYPNPANDYIQIQSDRDADISIINVQGKLVNRTKYTVSNGNLSINVQSLPSGLYTLIVADQYGNSHHYKISILH